jgi:DNA-binding CsgD family transcriptional regulator
MQPFLSPRFMLCFASMKPQSLTLLQRRVIKYIAEHGGMLAAARSLGVHRSYLWKLREGKHMSPSGKLLEKLGLRSTEKLVVL